MPPALEARAVTVAYGPTVAVNRVSLTVQPGEVLALLGPSGSGKTTLLHAAAGFVDLEEGELLIDGQLASSPSFRLPPERRRIGLVFQSYALWPHMSALDTVAYPYVRRGTRTPEARRLAGALLERLGLKGLEQRKPGQMSGGQQQRVGLARALAVDPVLFLFDEPTANLDAGLRERLQGEIREQQRRTGAGALYVTHDPAEAFAVADRVAVLRDGKLIQVGEPTEVYRAPADRWVARLTGPASILEARLAGDRAVEIGGKRVSCEISFGSTLPDADGEVRLCLRPEWVRLEPPGTLPLRGAVREARFQGPHTDYYLDSEVGPVVARVPGMQRFADGESVSWSPEAVSIV